MAFKRAEKHEAKLKLAIAGPSGSGKTYSALAIATVMSPDSVAALDTENKSMAKYADRFGFYVDTISPPYSVDKYINGIREAVSHGFEVLIIDSISHAWSATGGVLEEVDKRAQASKSRNTYHAWAHGTKIQNSLIAEILNAPIHIIATIRSKQEYVLEDVNGKQVPRKVGMKPIQRDDIEYEFDMFAEMDVNHNMIIQKTRCPALEEMKVFGRPGGDVAHIIMDWLTGVPAQKPEPKPEPAQAPKQAQKPQKTDKIKSCLAFFEPLGVGLEDLERIAGGLRTPPSGPILIEAWEAGDWRNIAKCKDPDYLENVRRF